MTCNGEEAIIIVSKNSINLLIYNKLKKKNRDS